MTIKQNELTQGILDSIGKRLSSKFAVFDDWKPGYYAPDDTACSELLEHDGCCHIKADVEGVERANFTLHFPTDSHNIYVWEYSGEPGAGTFIRATAKPGYDLIMTLDDATRYVVACSYIPFVGDYYMRGIKEGAADGDDDVNIDLSNYYTKEETDEKFPTKELVGGVTTAINAAVGRHSLEIEEIRDKLGDIDSLLNEILGEDDDD